MPSPKSSIPDIGTASLRKTNRQLAYERALCINKSHFGETVLGRNMTETKVLEAKLEQLEKDKLMLERDHFWRQRQFLISKAFDKERRLRTRTTKENFIRNKPEVEFFPTAKPPARTSTILGENKYRRTVAKTGKDSSPSSLERDK
uniref:Uncharacterized protein n=1 Tax=Magallana gigas TaxID=29159 RepID=K1PIM6_MAGGI